KASGPCCDREHRVVRRRSAGYCGQPPPVTGAGRGELEGTVRVSEIPAKATESEDPSDGARSDAVDGPVPVRGGDAASADPIWQSSPPGSMYDYIKVASFSIGPDGLVDQWSLRAEQLLGVPAEQAVGMDPIAAFVDPARREQGQRKMAEILDGREWTGVVPVRLPHTAEDGAREGEHGREGLAEVYVMPTRTEDGEKAAVCIVVDVRTLRSIETDLAAS